VRERRKSRVSAEKVRRKCVRPGKIGSQAEKVRLAHVRPGKVGSQAEKVRLARVRPEKVGSQTKNVRLACVRPGKVGSQTPEVRWEARESRKNRVSDAESASKKNFRRSAVEHPRVYFDGSFS